MPSCKLRLQHCVTARQAVMWQSNWLLRTHSNCAASRHTCKALGPCSSTTGHVSSSGVTPGPSSPPPARPLLADKAASSTGPHPMGSGTAQPQSCRLASPQGYPASAPAAAPAPVPLPGPLRAPPAPEPPEKDVRPKLPDAHEYSTCGGSRLWPRARARAAAAPCPLLCWLAFAASSNSSGRAVTLTRSHRKPACSPCRSQCRTAAY